MDPDRLNEIAVAAAKKLNVDDAVALSVDNSERMVRFANNSATVIKHVKETELTVYLAKDSRRAIASTSNPDEANVKRFVADLFASLKGLPKSDYVPLPDRAMRYRPSKQRFDRRIANVGSRLPELAGAAIAASLDAGAQRSAGVIEASAVSFSILTSTGTRGADARTSITLNIRSFADNDASGHGLSCSSTLSGFNPGEAGRRAGDAAKKTVKASAPEPGDYQVLLSPVVASNLIETVASAASAFSVDAGISYLAEKLDKRVAAESFGLTDHGSLEGALGGRSFDDEGMPTGSTRIIEGGTLKGYLHNLTTAKKWKTQTTGNAGLVSPHPWNLEVSPGNSSYDEMVREMKRGVILTSNWYTRFKNYRTGEFSTVPRDGAYLVENGAVVGALKGMRLSDDLLRMFSSVRLLSRDREWVEWWEVDTPTLCPWVLVDGARITRAYE
ncbi:MAG: TldD/PmbA family protein [Nitrososphaerales archaeon]|nr:TldD/PmbA family protein [Nitrososphaerales archaeon]